MIRLVLALALFGAPAVASAAPRLLALPAKPFTWEKTGTLVLIHCPKKWDDCGDFENLAIQVEPDFDGLLDKARAAVRKKEPAPGDVLANVVIVDQFGGPWQLQLTPAGAGADAPKFLSPFQLVVRPGFPGYQVTGSGADMKVDVLADQKQWDDARRELGLDKPKKKGFGALFQ